MARVFEFAMDIIHRALVGEPGALNFLNRTSSIYLLDATDPTAPKTYGCWNFINQAMNELERFEAFNINNNNNNNSQQNAAQNAEVTTMQLIPHVQLLAAIAQRVAQRSPAADQALVATCIHNASQLYNKGTPQEAQSLIQANHELREIVMGRIAAMVFDPAFHGRQPLQLQQRSNNSHHNNQQQPESAFANPIAMESFCAVLSANAVSSGPNAMNQFVSEWIVPSVQTLPPFAVVCVTLHVAQEAMRTSSAPPAGSQDMLRRLVYSIISNVLGPILSDAILEQTTDGDIAGGGGGSNTASHLLHHRIAAMALRALERWCLVTGLSLAHVKSICTEVKINVISLLSDSMYSDSQLVIESLAEFLESATNHHVNTATTFPNGMDLNRRQPLTVDGGQNNNESQSIFDELVSAIGLQRFRFVERQANGDHEVCRNLTRIAATICKSRLQYIASNRQTTSGIVDLLVKAAAHPSLNICGIALELIPALLRIEPSLTPQILPILQRRAIIPHRNVQGTLCLSALEMCGVNVLEFQSFREHVLADTLIACWRVNSNNYMDSCTLAIEEFCAPNSSSASSSLSFQMEAALFCLSVAAGYTNSTDGISWQAHSNQLERCTVALAGKPASVWENPCTLGQMCKFLRQYVRWYCEGPMDGALDIAIELSISTFRQSASPFPDDDSARRIMQETMVSPYSEAALTIRALLSRTPHHFVSNQAIAALGATWEASYAACNRPDILTLEDRKILCSGICNVLSAVPESQRAMSFHALALPGLDCLGRMVELANSLSPQGEDNARLSSVLTRAADELQILTVMSTTFSHAVSGPRASMESGCRTSPDRVESIKDPAFAVIRRAWPNVLQVTAKYCSNENISDALGFLLVECIPTDCANDDGINLFKELCGIATIILSQECKDVLSFQPVFLFVNATIECFGDVINKSLQERFEGLTSSSERDYYDEVGKCLEEVILRTISAVRYFLGSTWSRPNEQHQGQPAFESRTSPVPEERSSSSDAFPSIFEMFTTCATHCPVFLLNLPINIGSDREDGTLLNQAVESAVPCISDADPETSTNAILFLVALMKLCGAASPEHIRSTVVELVSRVRPTVIKVLVSGSCGRFNRSSLSDVAILLHALLSSIREGETHKSLVASLRQESFLAGDNAKTVAINFLSECARGTVAAERLASFLDDLWLIHQTENTDAVAQSDAVLTFVRNYGSPPTVKSDVTQPHVKSL